MTIVKNAKMKIRMKRELNEGKPTIWIGKSGASSDVVDEVDNQLERREMVKVRVLKSALVTKDTRTIASLLAQETRSTLVAVRGHTFILFRQKSSKES